MVTLFDLQDPAAGALAVEVVRVLAVKIALRMFIVVVFSALPAGGDSKFPTFLDCGVMWLVGIPVTFFAVHGLGLPSVSTVFLLGTFRFLIKMMGLLQNRPSFKKLSSAC